MTGRHVPGRATEVFNFETSGKTALLSVRNLQNATECNAAVSAQYW